MTVEQKAEEYKKKNTYFQATKRADGTCGAEEVSKVSISQAFIDGYKECEEENAKLKRIVKMVAMINTGIYTNEGIKAIYEEAERFINNVDISTKK